MFTKRFRLRAVVRLVAIRRRARPLGVSPALVAARELCLASLARFSRVVVWIASLIQIGIVTSVRGRLSREESQARTRTELLAAAARVFARSGYHGASVAEIAEEAGYSHGAVYSNFAGKEELFLALYEEWIARRVAEMEGISGTGSQPLRERVRAFVELMMQRLAGDPDPFVLRLEFTARASRDPELRSKLGTRARAVPEALARLVEAGAREEGLRLQRSPREVALAVQGLIMGLALEALLMGAEVDEEFISPGRAADLAVLLIDRLMSEGGEPT